MIQNNKLIIGETIKLQGKFLETKVMKAKRGNLFTKGIFEFDTEKIPFVLWKVDKDISTGALYDVYCLVQKYEDIIQIDIKNYAKHEDITLVSEHKKLMHYYRHCVESEFQGNIEKGEVASLPYIEYSKNNFFDSLDVETKLNDTSDAHIKWFEKGKLQGADTTFILGYPIIKERKMGDQKFSPLAYHEVKVDVINEDINISKISNKITWNYGALSFFGLDINEKDYLYEKLNEISEEHNSDAERMEIGINILESELNINLGWKEKKLQQTVKINEESELLYQRQIFFDGQSSGIFENLRRDFNELVNKNDLDLFTSPLGVALGYSSNSYIERKRDLYLPINSNDTQNEAIQKALNSTLSCVTGPPGTGKSQFVVNLASMAVHAGRSVLIVSKNNQAVDVAVNRFQRAIPNSWPLRVGSSDKREKVAKRIFEVVNKKRDITRKSEIKQKIEYLTSEIKLIETDIVRYDSITTEIENETKKYKNNLKSVKPLITNGEDSELVKDIIKLMEKILHKNKRINIIKNKKINEKNLLVVEELKEINKKIKSESLKKYILDEIDAENDINYVNILKLKEGLHHESEDYNNLLFKKKYIDSLKSEKIKLRTPDILQQEKYKAIEERNTAIVDSLEYEWESLLSNPESINALEQLSISFGAGYSNTIKNNIKKSIGSAPVWATTNLSVGGVFPLEKGLFDLAIIDEASQCDIASILPILYRSKSAVIVGDPNQLKHITSIKKSKLRKIEDELGLTDLHSENYDYKENSAFLLCKSHTNISTILIEHYRSHPAIASFANNYIYAGQLIINTDPKNYNQGDGVFWHDVKGNSESTNTTGSLYNKKEALLVVELLEEISMSNIGSSIGVVTPFKAQVDLITNMIVKKDSLSGVNIRVATAHKFQGDEKDFIIMSPVLAQDTKDSKKEFSNDLNLVNVSVTRARRQLHIVGDREVCEDIGGILGALAQYSENLSRNKFESPAEETLYNTLISAGYRVELQVIIGNFRADLVVSINSNKIIIEVDGHPYHRNYVRDEIRDNYFRENGFLLYHISAKNALKGGNEVLEYLSSIRNN